MPRLSRGCQECRKRRVGCDGGLPSCRQCVLTNRHCSGPVQGRIFVDQTSGVTSRYGRALTHSEIRNHPVDRLPSPTGMLPFDPVFEFISSSTYITDTPSRTAWLRRLRDEPLEQRGPALNLSMQAVAIAYYGVESKNKAAIFESSRLYGAAMVQHSKAISNHAGDPDPDMIYTSVTLSLFEALKSTKAPAYAIHLSAAQKMIDSAGANVLQNELLRQVAVHVQHQTLLMMIMTSLHDVGVNPATKASTDTLRISAEDSPPAADRLIAQMFILWRIIRSEGQDTNSADIALCLDNVGSTIKEVWDEYQQDATICGGTLQYECDGETVYRDGPTALMIAHFAGAQLLFSKAAAVSASYASQTRGDPCKAIIKCASYLSRRRMFAGCAALSILLPVTLVALYGTSSRYRTMAHKILDSHSPGSPFEGAMLKAH